MANENIRKPIIAGNWKMNKTVEEAVSLLIELNIDMRDKKYGVDIVVCPPFTDLSDVRNYLNSKQVQYIQLGAQNMHFEKEGAYTGEISPMMLKDVGCQYVILGHSERRAMFGETDNGVNQKIKTALEYRLTPIMCVGETLEQRQSDQTFKVIEDYVKGGLEGLSQEEMLKVVMAYEPVWAIGTGETATPEQAQEVHGFIRGLVRELYGQDISEQIRIQYGGSAKPDNIEKLMAKPDIDGALVGGASLKADQFTQMIKKTDELYRPAPQQKK